MSIIHVRLPDELQAIIDRQIAAGRVESTDVDLAEAAFCYDFDI